MTLFCLRWLSRESKWVQCRQCSTRSLMMLNVTPFPPLFPRSLLFGPTFPTLTQTFIRPVLEPSFLLPNSCSSLDPRSQGSLSPVSPTAASILHIAGPNEYVLNGFTSSRKPPTSNVPLPWPSPGQPGPCAPCQH